MKSSLALWLIWLMCCFSSAASAQPTVIQEKPKSKEQIELEEKTYKLLSETLDEAVSLKLGENRAFVYSAAGNLLWEKDEKAARRSFGNAVSELIQAQNNPKKRFQFGNENLNYWSYIHRLVREQVVYGILPKDPELALDVFYATRPAELDNAVRLYRQIAAQSGKNPDLSTFKQEERDKFDQAVFEIYQEQNLKKEIAKNDPQKMAENLRESIAGGSDFQNILPDLDALNKKDHETAEKILAGFMDKLADKDYLPGAKSYVAYLLYNRFLAAEKKSSTQPGNNKNTELEFDGEKIKAIAGKEFDKLLIPDAMRDEFRFVENSMYLKKILPERYAELKPKLETLKTNKEWFEDMEASDNLGENPTLSRIAESSAKLSRNTRGDLYIKAVNQLATTETQEKISQMIQKIPDEKDREKAMEYLNTLTANKVKNDNFDDAKKAALQIKNEKDKIAALINLATHYHQKNTEESQKIAEDLMTETGLSVNQTPETETDFERFLPFISGYAEIKPDRAFELLLPIIEQSNELINAYVVLSNYHDKSYPYVEENEIIFGAQDSYSSFRWRYGTLIKKLATSDFERTANLIKTFRRTDVRIAAKLILAQSIFAK